MARRRRSQVQIGVITNREPNVRKKAKAPVTWVTGALRKGCGGRILALKQTVLLAVSANVSPVRGVSVAEALVRVSEPRLVLNS